jgi:beta-RFAP synthase
MIKSPRTDVTVAPANSFSLEVSDDSRDAVVAAIQKWLTHLAPAKIGSVAIDELPVSMKVETAPRHSGLGSGTQLAFAVATALHMMHEQSVPSSEDLAMAMGRGKRSAIGSYGFHQGGFLVDRGIESEAIAPLDMRIDFPEDWKVVLIHPRIDKDNGVFGNAELEAFKRLPATTVEESEKLTSLLRQKIVPSVLAHDFSTFAESVTEYGHQSGLFYSPIQGGAYASPISTKIVERVAGFGEFAIGQSSWGPLLFAIAKSKKDAQRLVDYLSEHCEDVVCHTSVTAADNQGMAVQQNSSTTR